GMGGTGGMGGGSASYELTVVKGFTAPESCFWDAANKRWYVSNMAPPASMDITTPDGEGWISRLDEKGAILEEKWVSGFDTPAGLRMHGDKLYVANITKVHGIDIAAGMVVETYNFPAALLLNDPAVDEATGIFYVSDTFGNALYTFKAGMIGSEDVFLTSPELAGPNGVLIDGGKVLVASLVDFNPANMGPFLSIDIATKAITPIGNLKGKWDGLEKDGAEHFLLGDNPTGQIFRVKLDGTSELMFDIGKDHGFAPAADFGYDPVGKVLCVPNLSDSVAFVKWQ
ncbi:MAG: hypothetical protein HUU21_34375, partial [Polyangiaceae bacterium]|nr:hypothetical protein [Polyangiaceae bacterium]